MKILYNASLKNYNTFHLNYLAECIIEISRKKDAISIFRGDLKVRKPFFLLGGGSNILFTEDYKGTILNADFRGIRITSMNEEKVIVTAGAGEQWDKLVAWSVSKGFCGLENLSLIPGKVGAVPVQNIGAYGSEAKDFIHKVFTVSTSDGSVKEFSNEECEFGYRESVFKKRLKNKYLITSVSFLLSRKPVFNISYGSLAEEVSGLGEVTTENIRKAVINIRRNKLPDPEVIGNGGSFFKNPVVSERFAEDLKSRYPRLPVFENGHGIKKIAAAWLIEECGWKGVRNGDAGVHEKQALVLVNYGNATGKEIFDLSESIKKSVKEKFGLELEREVEIIGTI